MDESELTGKAAQWYESYQAAEKDVAAAAADNDLSGWAYVRGCKPLVEGADIMNKVFDATYAKTESMDSKWATLENSQGLPTCCPWILSLHKLRQIPYS